MKILSYHKTLQSLPHTHPSNVTWSQSNVYTPIYIYIYDKVTVLCDESYILADVAKLQSKCPYYSPIK